MVRTMADRKRSYGAAVGNNAQMVLYKAPRTGGYALRNPAPPNFRNLSVYNRGVGVRGETKAVDLPNAAYAFPLNTSVAGSTLNLVSVGTAFNNRIGNKIAMKSLCINGALFAVASSPLAAERLRMIIVYDKQTNGVAPLWSDVVQAFTQASASSNTVDDGINLNNRDRFIVLRDRRFQMPNTLAATGADILVPTPTMKEIEIKEFIKLGNMEVQYGPNSSPEVIGGIRTGGLFAFFQGGTGGQWVADLTFRLRFTDN